jgi:hypothetical protein
MFMASGSPRRALYSEELTPLFVTLAAVHMPLYRDPSPGDRVRQLRVIARPTAHPSRHEQEQVWILAGEGSHTPVLGPPVAHKAPLVVLYGRFARRSSRRRNTEGKSSFQLSRRSPRGATPTCRQ